MLGCAFVVRGLGLSGVGVVAAAPRRCFIGCCLSCAAARWCYFGGGCLLALRARARAVRALGAPPVPSPLVGSRGPPVPCFASPARYARARQRCGGLRECGSALRAHFLSADANQPYGRLSLWLRVRFVSSTLPRVPSVQRPYGRCPLPPFWLVGSRVARLYRSWVSRSNRCRCRLVAPDHRTTDFSRDPPCDRQRTGVCALRAPPRLPAASPSALKGTDAPCL